MQRRRPSASFDVLVDHYAAFASSEEPTVDE
jgi:hypothetical protein